MSHAMAGELGREAFLEEAIESKKILEDSIGAPIAGFRASTFSITPATSWALDAVAEAGYRYDSSIFPVRHDRYGWPTFSRTPCIVNTEHGPLTELPMLTLRAFGINLPAAGGGYLRLLPLALIDTALVRMNRAGAPGVLYLHPWEFDPGQPRLLAGGLAAVRHYHGLGSTMAKLERLLARHRFTRLDALAAGVA
jgi:polysaccharide deacetylase family protein (PEP-CTERM system associated)